MVISNLDSMERRRQSTSVKFREEEMSACGNAGKFFAAFEVTQAWALGESG
jgi:hypothetical protein